MKNTSFNSQKPDRYDYEKITLIHRVINAQWYAKFGFRFFLRHPVNRKVTPVPMILIPLLSKQIFVLLGKHLKVLNSR
jgi:hypothetical protein